MKIAVVGPAYPFRGGIAHYTTLLAAHLKQEHEVRLYSFKQQYPNWLFPGRSQLDPSGEPLADIETRRWLTPWRPWSWWHVTDDWKVWQPDRVVVQWWVPFMAPMTAWLLAQARRLQMHSSVICHNVLPHERSRVDRVLARLALRHADQLIVHSMAQRAVAQDLLPGVATRVVSLPTYVAFQAGWTREQARAQLGVTGNVVLFFGLIRPYKGVLDLLDSLPAVLAEIDMTLLVVGEVWGDAAVYHSRVAELDLQAKVKFVDRYVSNEEAACYFAATDLAILPYREATGSAVLKLAFGLGVPVVATRTGGMDETVEDGVTGFLVEPSDVLGLSRAMIRFFAEERATDFRDAIVRQADRFGWTRLMKVIEQ